MVGPSPSTMAESEWSGRVRMSCRIILDESEWLPNHPGRVAIAEYERTWPNPNVLSLDNFGRVRFDMAEFD